MTYHIRFLCQAKGSWYFAQILQACLPLQNWNPKAPKICDLCSFRLSMASKSSDEIQSQGVDYMHQKHYVHRDLKEVGHGLRDMCCMHPFDCPLLDATPRMAL